LRSKHPGPPKGILELEFFYLSFELLR